MSKSEPPARDAFDGNVHNIDIGGQMLDFETIECDPDDHVGDLAVVLVMGSNDDDVRKISMCTACELVVQEMAFDDVQGITLEAVGTIRDRVFNYPGDEDLLKIPKDEVLDEKADELGYDDYEVTHAGYNEDELLFKITSTEADDD